MYVAAAVLMLGRVRPEKLYAQIDWNVLVMFAGLFVVVRVFDLVDVQRMGVLLTMPERARVGLRGLDDEYAVGIRARAVQFTDGAARVQRK